MANIIREYSCHLTFDKKKANVLESIRVLFSRNNIECDLFSDTLEFDHCGRDTTRHIEELLIELAHLLGSADGEIQCQIDDDENDIMFEFYRIMNNSLFKQPGKVVRGDLAEVKSEV